MFKGGLASYRSFARRPSRLPAQGILDITHDPLTSAGGESAEVSAEKSLVHRHFRTGRYKCEDASRMTFLRHSIDDLISIYFYWESLKCPTTPCIARFLLEVDAERLPLGIEMSQGGHATRQSGWQ
jgi:hypothetical protein